ncbi:MAG: hypothetical protein IKC60_02345, partial [Clostridia bacterium]|nr:hypothetical protein [Clostridia bacterium]
YDDEGNLIEIVETPISTLGGAKNSWFTTDPLSAVVTVNENGVVTVEGCESTWIYDIPYRFRAYRGIGNKLYTQKQTRFRKGG